ARRKRGGVERRVQVVDNHFRGQGGAVVDRPGVLVQRIAGIRRRAKCSGQGRGRRPVPIGKGQARVACRLPEDAFEVVQVAAVPGEKQQRAVLALVEQEAGGRAQ